MCDLDTSRTIECLRQLLRIDGKKNIKKVLPPLNIFISISEENALSTNGQFILTFLINLILRLEPIVDSVELKIPNHVQSNSILPRWYDRLLINEVKKNYGALKPRIKLRINEQPKKDYDLAIIIGGNETATSGKRLYVGSNGWKAILSTDSQIKIGKKVNPIGAYAAATLACAELFKLYLYPQRHIIKSIPIKPLDGKLDFSTFDYSVNDTYSTNPDIEIPLDIKRLTIIGLGAGGGAALYTLASMKKLKGQITCIEGDKITSNNLNRYIFADGSDVGQMKTIVGEKLFLNHTNVLIKKLSGPFIKKKKNLTKKDLEYVLATVHTREARVQIQYEIPKIIWDGAATERGEFMIWRIRFGETPCMRCKHPLEDNPERMQAKIFTEIIGLPFKNILEKITNNGAFSKKDIVAIKNYCKTQALQFCLPAEGEVFSDWEKKNCGKMNIPEINEEVPIPFAPVMAGILLASEVIKQHHFLKGVLKFQYWGSLLGVFSKHIKPTSRTPQESCPLCKDSVFLSQYKKYWK